MPWLDDLVTLMEDNSVATFGVDLWVSTKSTLPMLASGTGAVLSIVETSGSAPERTQNSVVRPGYIRPAAQILARANNYSTARAMAQAAYDAVVGIRNSWVIASREYVSGEGLQSGWYREITPLQEPFDAGVDDRKQARCGFNVIAVRRP